MKVPFSYRQQFFVPVLLFSGIGHAVLFSAGSGLLPRSPEFGVQQAPSSLEVVISKIDPEDVAELVFDSYLTKGIVFTTFCSALYPALYSALYYALYYALYSALCYSLSYSFPLNFSNIFSCFL